MKSEILSILKAADGFVSGEKISETLHVSRAAVWKGITKLRSEGYRITSVTNRGYLLEQAPDVVTEAELADGLETACIGKTIHFEKETDSTNNLAKRHADMPDGTLFIAERQTAGKGRRGNGWASPKGTGIWMSLLLKPDLPPERVCEITLVAGLAVCNGLNRFLDGAPAMIKWPNDIVVGGRKICGILTELSAQIEAVEYVVTGIGINVNMERFDDALSEKATSLYIETGSAHPRAAIVQAVLVEFETLYGKFLQGGFEAIRTDYKAACVTLHKEVKIIKKGETLLAEATDIAPDGALVIQRDGRLETVQSGEVSVRGIYGYV